MGHEQLAGTLEARHRLRIEGLGVLGDIQSDDQVAVLAVERKDAGELVRLLRRQLQRPDLLDFLRRDVAVHAGAVISVHVVPDQAGARLGLGHGAGEIPRSEEHTSELQSLMRISYAVFCLKKKNKLILMIR